VERTGRNEPIEVVIHICMETTQRLSLYSYLYLKLAKTPCFSCYSFMLFLLQNLITGGRNRFCSSGVEGELVEKGAGG
jgi:hypothetical protein